MTDEHKDQVEKLKDKAQKQAEEGQEQKAQMEEKAQAKKHDFKDEKSKAGSKQEETQGKVDDAVEQVHKEKGNNQFNQYR